MTNINHYETDNYITQQHQTGREYPSIGEQGFANIGCVVIVIKNRDLCNMKIKLNY